MKDLVDWLKSIRTSQISLAYILFFLIWNWPLVVFALHYNSTPTKENSSLYRLINNYLAAYPIESKLMPLALAVFFVISSPWIGYLIERLNSFANNRREIAKIKDEEEIEKEHKKLILKKIENHKLQEQINFFESNPVLSDKRVFDNLNSILSESELVRITNSDKLEELPELEISREDADKILKYLRSAKSIDYEYSDRSIQSLHEIFVESLDVLSGQLKRNNLPALRILEPEANIEKIYSDYRKYREKIKETLKV